MALRDSENNHGHDAEGGGNKLVVGANDQKPKRDTRWWIQFRTTLLFACFVVALGGAIGHHFWYSHLDGLRVEDQAWVVRGGTAISFAIKILFSASIGVGFAQHVWYNLRSKSYSLGAVDSLFTLRDNPFGFFSGEVLSNAKLATLIALLSWSLALVPILVPASISVRSAEQVQVTDRLRVMTLNFSKPHMESRYYEGRALFPIQLAYHIGAGATYDAYDTASSAATGFVYTTLYGKRIIEAPSPCGANCSFSQTFAGPAYKCDNIDFMTTTDTNNPFCAYPQDPATLGTCGGIFLDARNGFSVEGITWYRALNSSEVPNCDDNSTICRPLTGWEDGKLWVAHQYLQPSYRSLFDDTGILKDPTNKLPFSAFDRRMFACQSYNATYTIHRRYQNFQQFLTGNLTYLNPTNFTPVTTQTATPHSYAAYAIHQTLYPLLSGAIQPGGKTAPIDTTSLATSALVEEMPFPPRSNSVHDLSSAQKPILNLREAMEELHFNITVGLLSMGPGLLYADNGTTDGIVEMRAMENVWVYEPLVLVVVYAVAAVVDLVVIVVGVRAMVRNGGASGFEFARVVATTGGLDGKVGGWEDGVDPVPKGVERVRVRFRGVGEGRLRDGFEVAES
ncbi:hypothetical protein QBC34DRAFT_443396 [Podospora aff. communis PSN243]|uniref:Uncharacterized protein n=1 Tax=Podospora aff. communis PSN243 TaxID=3040156 RepID=A0AAV9G5L4_9PEZI|nr:hypothetical protein QBC34DRAFT_443396 [Podospora aff. communis PSN243]